MWQHEHPSTALNEVQACVYTALIYKKSEEEGKTSERERERRKKRLLVESERNQYGQICNISAFFQVGDTRQIDTERDLKHISCPQPLVSTASNLSFLHSHCKGSDVSLSVSSSLFFLSSSFLSEDLKVLDDHSGLMRACHTRSTRDIFPTSCRSVH